MLAPGIAMPSRGGHLPARQLPTINMAHLVRILDRRFLGMRLRASNLRNSPSTATALAGRRPFSHLSTVKWATPNSSLIAAFVHPAAISISINSDASFIDMNIPP